MSFPRHRFVPHVLAVLIAGCGGAGVRHAARDRAGLIQGNYTGTYALASSASGATDGAIVMDISADGAADGSLTVSGTVYDFTGRIGDDGQLEARGEGIAVRAGLDRIEAGATRTLNGLLNLSGGVNVRNARATLTRVVATS